MVAYFFEDKYESIISTLIRIPYRKNPELGDTSELTVCIEFTGGSGDLPTKVVSYLKAGYIEGRD